MEAHNGKCISRYILHHKLRRANTNNASLLHRTRNYLIDSPEAEDIGGAINAAMKASADENEELGGALPRNYNSLEKPILRELLKILNRISRKNITEDAFGEISQYFLGNFAQKEGSK